MSASNPPDAAVSDCADAPRVAFDRDPEVTCAHFPRGKVDGIAVRELFEAAMALTSQPRPRLVVDLTGVALATSGLMGILTQRHKRFVQNGGRVTVAVPDARVLGAFEVAKLHTILCLYPSVGLARTGALA